MASKSQAGDTGKLTERDRFWLGHHEACQASGQVLVSAERDRAA